jgi:uncharacterized membrane protein
MPSSFEPAFEFLFKYRPVVFEKGRFAFAAPWSLRLLVFVCLAAAVAAVLTYTRARGKARRGDLVALAGLRVALVLVLLFCLCRPTLIVETVTPQQSFVGVLIDDSKSLAIADVGGAPRSDYVAKSLAKGAPLLRSLEERFKLRFFRFAAQSDRLNGLEELAFSGTTTDIAGALGRAKDEMAGVPLSGLVLVSDGADNGRGRLSETLLALKAAKLPVFTVGLGRERFSKDIDVGRVEAPRAVLRGTSLSASVWLRARGFARSKVQLLVEDASRVLHAQEIELPDEGEALAARVHVALNDPGPRLLRFRVAPREGEQVTQNNQQDALVHVLDRREKILYFEGETRFEPKFVRRAVAEDKNLQLVTLMRTAKNKYLRMDVDDAEELAAGFPKTREELFRYRGVVLGSVEASLFTSDQLRMLADFVSQRGGGLLMIGGSRAFSEGGYAGTSLAEALPVLLEPRPAPAEAFFLPLRVELTPAGATHGATQLGATEQESARRWSGLPAVSAANLIRRTKPGAATLVTGRAEGGGEAQVVLAHQRYGRGKAIAFAIQDSWRWQMNPETPVEDMTHENLWRQLLRWLVSGVPGQVTIAAVEDRVAPGGTVTLRAEVADDTYLGVNNAQVVATVKDPSGHYRELPLEWAVETDGEYRAAFTAKELGLHEIRVATKRKGATLGEDVTYVQVADLDAEFHDAEMRPALLKRIAEETGGRFYTPETSTTLAEDLSYTEGGVSVLEQRDLWDMPALYLLMIGLVSSEWGYRKLRGLA